MEGGPKNPNEVEKKELIRQVILYAKEDRIFDGMFPIPDEIIKSPEVQKAAIERISSYFFNHSDVTFDWALEMF